jgi:hypothetical protein
MAWVVSLVNQGVAEGRIDIEQRQRQLIAAFLGCEQMVSAGFESRDHGTQRVLRRNGLISRTVVQKFDLALPDQPIRRTLCSVSERQRRSSM